MEDTEARLFNREQKRTMMHLFWSSSILLLLFLCFQHSWGFVTHQCFRTFLHPLRSTTLLVEPESEHDTADIEQFLTTEYGVVADGCSWHVTKLSNKQESSAINDCFKAQLLVPSTSSSHSDNIHSHKHTTLFIKRSKGKLSNVSPDHLRYEFEGMKAFSKYSKGLIATPLMYNHDRQILVTEFLPDFVPLTHFFSFSSTVDVDVDVYQAMGTAMGRSHARSHRDILEPEQYSALKVRFRNLEHFSLWEQQLFVPTQQTLLNGVISATDSNEATIDKHVHALLQRYNSYGDGDATNTIPGPLSDAIELLRHTYMEKKEALVHADLHCNNVLISLPGTGSSRRDRDMVDFKVIDFGACAMGPAGLDLGMFLAGFLWYYAGHSEASWRRNVAGGVMAVIDAYKQAFRVQLTGGALGKVANTKEPILNIEKLLDEILIDAMGFMGAYTLFMSLHGVKKEDQGKIKETSTIFEILTLQDMPELSFGDVYGRLQSVHRRQITMSIHALLTYLDCVEQSHDQKVQGGSISLPTKFAAIFAADDKVLQRSKDHVTEFWYY